MSGRRPEGRAAQVLARWAEHDALRALHAVDREAIRATEAARSLVLELFEATSSMRDLYSACARLGRLMAEAGASPSLASGVVDGAARALSNAGVTVDASCVAAARASLVEGYVAGVREAAQAASLASWEYPACAVPVDDGVVAVTCCYPADDAEALAGWAARVAGGLMKAKVRRVILSGPSGARAEVGRAAELVGIDVTTCVAGARNQGAHDAQVRPKSWLRLPWRKSG